MSVTDRPSSNGDAPEPSPGCPWTPEAAQGESGGISGLVDLVGDYGTATLAAIIGIGTWEAAEAAYGRAIGPVTQFAVAEFIGAVTE